jgi:hypothetical protein
VKGFEKVIMLVIQKGNGLGSVQRLQRIFDVAKLYCHLKPAGLPY